MLMKSSIPRMLVRLRGLKGFSQSALAKRAGISKSSLNQIESGLALDLKVSTLIRLCEALHATPDQILGWNLASREDECKKCGKRIIAGDEHSVPECMLEMWERFWPVARIASIHGFTVSSVDRILTDQYEIRRRKRKLN